MLVLSRRPDEDVVIGGSLIVRVLSVQGKRVQLGFLNSEGVTIVRKEVLCDQALPLPETGSQTNLEIRGACATSG